MMRVSFFTIYSYVESGVKLKKRRSKRTRGNRNRLESTDFFYYSTLKIRLSPIRSSLYFYFQFGDHACAHTIWSVEVSLRRRTFLGFGLAVSELFSGLMLLRTLLLLFFQRFNTSLLFSQKAI